MAGGSTESTWRTHFSVSRSHSCERLVWCSQECEHGTHKCVRYDSLLFAIAKYGVVDACVLSLSPAIERTAGQVKLSPSTLYSAIKRLLEEGLIQELEERPDPAHDDERRRYYRLTKAGRRAAIDEAKQLEKLLSDARSSGLVPKRV